MNFYNIYDICYDFYAPKTSKQNGIVERKNRIVQKMARALLHAKELSYKF